MINKEKTSHPLFENYRKFGICTCIKRRKIKILIKNFEMYYGRI